MRSVSKLCLNCFWGKFGQRDNMGTTEIIRDDTKLNEILESTDRELIDLLPVNQEVFYMR